MVLQRTVMTSIAMIGAILLLALLEAMFLDPEDETAARAPAPAAA